MTLTEVFGKLEDPRAGPAKKHDLCEMILIALCAVLCGADSWVDVADCGEDNEEGLKGYLKLAHGTASHDTYSRVNLNSSICRSGNPARHRAVENAPSPDETPMGEACLAPTGHAILRAKSDSPTG
jgi:hypothetical protein